MTPEQHEHEHEHGHSHALAQAQGDAHGEFRIVGVPEPAAASAEYLGALGELLMEKGILAADEIRRKRAEIRARGPHLGAKVVVRAWTDDEFRSRLLVDATEAVRELGIEPLTPSQARLVALENTDDTHHVVVCTLCSCYPIALLGPAPDWYRSDDYRTRVISEPERVLKEFGLRLPDSMRIKVVDSTAECRYLVIPRRPHGTEGLAPDELEALVTPESMVGTSEVRAIG
jgi:nitrile hydratase